MFRNIDRSRVIAVIFYLSIMTSLHFLQFTADACDSNAQCKNGRICVDSVCKEPPNGCASDTECPGSLVCIDRKCFENKPAETVRSPKPASSMSTSVPEIVVESPLPGSQVGHVNTIRGTFAARDRTKVYRAVVRPHSLDNYHPQAGVLVFEGRTFSGTAYIGPRDGGLGDCFDLLIVASLPAVDEVFNAYLRTATSTGWIGMSSLPPGATIVQEIKGLVRR
jgi:hypothetical protein